MGMGLIFLLYYIAILKYYLCYSFTGIVKIIICYCHFFVSTTTNTL